MRYEINIPKSTKEIFTNKVDKLNKKCEKFGFSKITYTNVGECVVKVDDYETMSTVKVECYKMIVEGETPVIEGWKFIGTIEHIDGYNIIKTFTKDDTTQFDREPYCDHCKTKKIKKNSVIIKNEETNEIMQIGKGCLKDFFNKELSSMLDTWNKFFASFDEIDEDSFYGSSNKNDYVENVHRVLKASVAIVRKMGEYVKSDSYSGEQGTVGIVRDFLLTDSKKSRDEIVVVTDEDYTKADVILNWLKNELEPNNEYTSNLKKLAEIGYVKYNNIGIVASAVVAYDRELLKRKEKVEIKSEYVAVVGDKIELNVTFISSHTFDTAYGWSTILTFVDNDNRLLKWFTQSECNFEKGENLTLKGTVKKHNEYKDVKETIVTRCSLKK